MKNIISTIFCLLNIILIQECHCTNTTQIEFIHLPDYDGKTCTEDEILFRNVPHSSIVCSSLCTDDESCTGVYYTPKDGSCVGCSASPFSDEAALDNEPGTSHFHQCKAMDGASFFEGSKYKLFTEVKTMVASRVSCREVCGDLVHINSIEEQTFLANFVTDWKTFIGLTDVVKEGDMRWLDDGTKPMYTNWMDGEPYDLYSIENCVAMFRDSDFKWADVPCEREAAYVCEKKL